MESTVATAGLCVYLGEGEGEGEGAGGGWWKTSNMV